MQRQHLGPAGVERHQARRLDADQRQEDENRRQRDREQDVTPELRVAQQQRQFENAVYLAEPGDQDQRDRPERFPALQQREGEQEQVGYYRVELHRHLRRREDHRRVEVSLAFLILRKPGQRENGAEEHREVEQVPYERADRHAEVGERREQDCEQRAVQEVVLFDAVRVFPFPEIERAVLERKKVVLFAVRHFQQRQYESQYKAEDEDIAAVQKKTTDVFGKSGHGVGLGFVGKSAGDRAWDTERFDARGDRPEFGNGYFAKVLGRGVPVDRVDHYLTRSDFGDSCQPGRYFFFGGVVHRPPAVLAAQEHRLDNQPSVEAFHVLDRAGYRIVPARKIDLPHRGVECRIEFQDVVVHLQQGFAHLFPPDHRSVAEHRYFGFRAEFVARGDRIVDDGAELGMHRGFAVACEGDDVGRSSRSGHFEQFGPQ